MIKKRPWDVIATVRLLPTNQGGRHEPTPASSFGCLMQIDAINLDVRLRLEEVGRLAPSQSARVPMRFLNPALAQRSCVVGTHFKLREVKTIAEGIIEETAFESDEPGSASRVA